MRNLKIFPKLFVQTFAILGILIVVVHIMVFLMFPKVYLENRKSKRYRNGNSGSKYQG